MKTLPLAFAVAALAACTTVPVEKKAAPPPLPSALRAEQEAYSAERAAKIDAQVAAHLAETAEPAAADPEPSRPPDELDAKLRQRAEDTLDRKLAETEALRRYAEALANPPSKLAVRTARLGAEPTGLDVAMGQSAWEDTIRSGLLDPDAAQIRWLKPQRACYLPATETGKPVWHFGWEITAMVNAKNAFGGYTGARPWRFYTRNGAYVAIAHPDHAGLAGELPEPRPFYAGSTSTTRSGR